MTDPLAAKLQYTLFSVGLGDLEISRACDAALKYGFHAVMVPGRWVPRARDLLSGSPVRVASAVDFPYGLMSPRGRLEEARALEDAGAQEVDLAIPIALLLAGDDDALLDDTRAVVESVSVPVKAMLELPLLTTEQRVRVVRIALDAGVAYLKNASGGEVGVATPADIKFLRASAPAGIGVKASGAIRTRAHAESLIEAGADLVGTSAAIDIVTGSAGPASTKPSY